jgi:hypothetical protein
MRRQPTWLRVLGFGIAALAVSGSQPPGAVAAQNALAGAARAGEAAQSEHRKAALARTAADSPGKPQAPIEFDFELLGTPALGQPLAIRIDARTRNEEAKVDVTLGGSGLLWVAAEAAEWRGESARNKTRSGRTIEVVPLADGPLHLDVLLQVSIDGRRQSRSVAIPIQVGSISTAPTIRQAVSTDAAGQLIVSLPAASQ